MNLMPLVEHHGTEVKMSFWTQEEAEEAIQWLGKHLRFLRLYQMVTMLPRSGGHEFNLWQAEFTEDRT